MLAHCGFCQAAFFPAKACCGAQKGVIQETLTVTGPEGACCMGVQSAYNSWLTSTSCSLGQIMLPHGEATGELLIHWVVQSPWPQEVQNIVS